MSFFIIFKIQYSAAISLFTLGVVSLFTCLNLEASENSLDDNYKLQILGNVGMKSLLIHRGDAAAYLADWNKCTPLNGCDYDFSLLFPDNYIGSSNFLYVFSINAGKFDMNRQGIYFKHSLKESNMSFQYPEVDLDTSVTGEYLDFYSTLIYSFFRDSFINFRPGLGIGFGQANFQGDYYLTDNKRLTNTLDSECWDYTHTNESFEEISKYCQKSKIQKNLQSLGIHIHLDFRIKYFGFKIDAYTLGEDINQENRVNFTYVVQGLYVLVPF